MARLSGLASSFMGKKPPPASGVADYEAVDENAPEAAAQAGADVRSATAEAGLSFQAPAQEAPDVADPGIYASSLRAGQMAKLMRGLVGTTMVDSYGAKLGQKAGAPINSPAWDAVEEQAQNPWKTEQLRVANANKLHAFVNQYSMLKSEVDNKNTQASIDRAKDLATTAGYKGMFGQQMDLAKQQMDIEREGIDLRNKMLDKSLSHQAFMEDATQKRLDLADQANQRAQKSQEFKFKPGLTDAEKYASASRATEALQNIDKLLQDPDVTTAFRGATASINPTSRLIDFSGGRISASPKAMQLKQQIQIAHHHLLMMDPRQGTKFGASLLTNVFPMIGDNAAAARGPIRQLMGGPMMVLQTLKDRYPGYDPSADIQLYDKMYPLPPEAQIQAPGDSIDAELQKRGIK